MQWKQSGASIWLARAAELFWRNKRAWLFLGAVVALLFVIEIVLVLPNSYHTEQEWPVSFSRILPILGNEATKESPGSSATNFDTATSTTSPVALSNAALPQKVILIWRYHANDFLGAPYPTDADTWPQLCGPATNCIATSNSSHAGIAHAIFFPWWFIENGDPVPPAENRKPFQRYVILFTESPAFHALFAPPPGDRFANFFNWTMGYRTDSDIFYPYGFIRKRADPVAENEWRRDIDDKIKLKTGLVAGMFSSCHAHRMKLLKELQAIDKDIHTFGACGTTGSYVPKKGLTYRASIARDYFFYMAFENSLCRDYLTEKMFVTLTKAVVPIVLVRNITANAGIPSGAFIAVDDFKNLTDFVSYLKYLRNNHTAYAAYFQWKRYSESEPHMITAFDSPHCQNCEFLRRRAKEAKNMHDIIRVKSELKKIFDWNNFLYERELESTPFETAFCPICNALYNDSMPVKIYEFLTQTHPTECLEINFH